MPDEDASLRPVPESGAHNPLPIEETIRQRKNAPPTSESEQRPRLHNRMHVIMAHTSRYSFEGQARLAKDIGVSRSTISRAVGERSRPSFALVQKVTAALEQALGKRLDAREIFSLDGMYPTASGCKLCGCPGCMPEEAYDARGNLRPAFRNLKPGDWSFSPRRDTTVKQQQP